MQEGITLLFSVFMKLLYYLQYSIHGSSFYFFDYDRIEISYQNLTKNFRGMLRIQGRKQEELKEPHLCSKMILFASPVLFSAVSISFFHDANSFKYESTMSGVNIKDINYIVVLLN
jgi:hypothetical protein